MKNSNTYYVRFGEHEAVLVEVCVIDEQCREPTTWFEDRHLQEVLQLIHDVLAVRVAQLQCKKASTIKASPYTGNIITGNTVRVGYMFKNRPGNQKCLVPNSYLTSTACDEAGELSSFSVVKEKLLVYVCEKIAGSPQAISKLMKVLGDVKQQTMSISNYFQKVPSPQKPGSHSVPSTSGSVPTHPPSEGRKRTIKNILERRENRRKDKIAKKSTKGRLSDLSRFLTKRGDATCSTGTANNISNTHNKDSSASSTEMSSPNSQHVEASSNNGISVNSVTAKQVDGSTLPLTGANSAASYSVTLIIGEQVTDTHNERVPQSTNCSSTTTVTESVCTSSISPNISSASLSSVCKSVPGSPQLATYSGSVSPGSNSTIPLDVLKSCTVSSRVPESSSDSSGEEAILPSASFLTKPREQKPVSTHLNKSDDSDQFADKVSLLGTNQLNSPVFVKRKYDDKSKCDTIDDCADISTKLNSGSEHKEVTVHNRKEVKKRSKLRWKRKLPDFSDSDSEEIDRLKVNTKSRKLEPMSMKENKQKHIGKKFNISKSFFSEEKDKVQPTLACFMGNKTTKTVADEQNNNDRKATGKDTEDFDCHLLEELSNFPIVKKEIDADIKREIQSLNDVSELNEQHLQFLVRNSERYLRDIFQGKVKCERHNMYKQGGKHKRNLTYDSGVGNYTEEQVDTVMEALMAIFCKRHHRYLDYIMKVLLPEMLTKFYDDINGRANTNT